MNVVIEIDTEKMPHVNTRETFERYLRSRNIHVLESQPSWVLGAILTDIMEHGRITSKDDQPSLNFEDINNQAPF
jgi:hypothetical protein